MWQKQALYFASSLAKSSFLLFDATLAETFHTLLTETATG